VSLFVLLLKLIACPLLTLFSLVFEKHTCKHTSKESPNRFKNSSKLKTYCAKHRVILIKNHPKSKISHSRDKTIVKLFYVKKESLYNCN